jgi:hypothetical protein
LPFDRVLPNEANFKNQPSQPNSFFAKQTQFSELAKCPNSFANSWLLKAGGWPLSQKTNPNKANLQDGLVIPFSVFMARLSAFEQSCPYG